MGSSRFRWVIGQHLRSGVLAGFTAALIGTVGAGPAMAAEVVEAQVVREIDTYEWTPPSGDPSGVVRVGDRLVVVDSEVDERDKACYGGSVNMWEVSLSDPAHVIATAKLPTNEPSGVSYDPANKLLFVSDDENVGGRGNKIWVVDYENPSNVRGEIELGELARAIDVEDPAYDPTTGELFSVGLVRLPDGSISAVLFRMTSSSPTFSSGVTIHTSSIDHLHPTDDFEGLAIDPNSGHLLIATQQGRQIYVVDRNDPALAPIRIIDASRTGIQYISGLTAVDVDGETHYWVTDRRSDCVALDGLLLELTTGPVTNRPPTIEPIANRQVSVGETLTFAVEASDPDPGQSLTYSLPAGHWGASIDPVTGVFSWIAEGSGETLFTVRVTDNGTPVMSAQRSFTVEVTRPNTAPTLVPIGPQQVVEGETLAFVVRAFDPDNGQELTYALSDHPPGATLHPTFGEFSWMAQGVGDHQFTISVMDNGSPALSDSETITVKVLPKPGPDVPPGDPGTPPDEPRDPPGLPSPGTPPREPGDPEPPPGGPDRPPNLPGGGGSTNPKGPSPSEPGTPSASFADTSGHVFEADIEWLAAKGITRGCNPPTNDRFCPDDYVTRGQMAAFLVRALGYTDDGGGNKFVDDNGSVFEGDIDRLATAGVTRGCNPPTNSRFCPDDRVTRGQMAAFLVRALNLTGSDAGDRFGDDEGHVFESDIELLAAAGVTRGCNPPTNSRFCPDDYVTRGQMAAFLHRALGE